jgi:hypothetical protein
MNFSTCMDERLYIPKVHLVLLFGKKEEEEEET